MEEPNVWRDEQSHSSRTLVLRRQKTDNPFQAGGGNSSIPVYMGVGVVKGFEPITVLGLLRVPGLWDPWFQESHHVESLDSATALSYYSLKGGLLSGSRDFAQLERVHYEAATGTIRVAISSIESPQIPPRPERVRAFMKLSGWVLEPISHSTGVVSTNISYLLQTDYKGLVPHSVSGMWMARRCMVHTSVNAYLQRYGASAIPPEPAASACFVSHMKQVMEAAKAAEAAGLPVVPPDDDLLGPVPSRSDSEDQADSGVGSASPAIEPRRTAGSDDGAAPKPGAGAIDRSRSMSNGRPMSPTNAPPVAPGPFPQAPPILFRAPQQGDTAPTRFIPASSPQHRSNSTSAGGHGPTSAAMGSVGGGSNPRLVPLRPYLTQNYYHPHQQQQNDANVVSAPPTFPANWRSPLTTGSGSYVTSSIPSPMPTLASIDVIASPTPIPQADVHRPRGALIVIEGLDRSGISTQCDILRRRIGERAAVWRFPDRSTPIGKMIETYLNGAVKFDERTLHQLFATNRSEAMPALQRQLLDGTTVVVDRYAYSGVAYTLSKRLPGMDLAWCKLGDSGILHPDLVVFLDLQPEIAALRVATDGKEAARTGAVGKDRPEQAEAMRSIRSAFMEVFEAEEADNAEKSDGEKLTWVAIEARRPVEEIADRVYEHAAKCIESCMAGMRPLQRLWP
ncbi:thymidylate kinase-domain-containing protein [Zopfochytrium polystomum]|nr:thymidylate kinase-domain-containing protein [Zopfochytrium polystomum]